MYDFIFYCMYSQQRKKGKSDNFSKYNGSLIAGLTLVIHFGLIIAVTRAFYFKTMRYHPWVLLDTFYLKAICLIIMVLPFFYYTKSRVLRIREQHNEEYISFNVINIIKFLLITVLPLLVIIKLSSR